MSFNRRLSHLLLVFVGLCSLPLLSGCGSVKRKYETLEVRGDIRVKPVIHWVKNKRDAVDVRLELMNQSGFPATIPAESLGLNVDGQEGRLNTSNADFHLATGASKSNILTFEFPKKVAKNAEGQLRVNPIKLDDGKSTATGFTVKLPLN